MSSIYKGGIGLFGGSFDPPHLGHLKVSNISIKKLNLNKLYWVVTKKNPFKKKTLFSLKNRITKAKRISKKNKAIKIIYLEDKVKSSRFIKVINYFLKKYKKKDLYLVIGSDNLINFHKWTSWKKIVKITKLVVFPRKEYDKKSKKSVVVKYLKKKNIIFIKSKKINISSSKIRYKLIKRFR